MKVETMVGLRRILLPLLALVAIVAIAACGGGSSDGGRSVSPELQAIEDKAASSTFKATYRTTGTEADVLEPGTLIVAKDGAARISWTTAATTNGKTVSTIFIETPELSATCLSEAGDLGAVVGVDPAQGLCLSNPRAESGGSLREFFSVVDTANATLLEKSKRTIAGREGACYRTQDNAVGEVSTVCFTDDGILLYNSTEGDDAFEMEAQTVSSSVSDSDFELPYELKELPNLGG